MAASQVVRLPIAVGIKRKHTEETEGKAQFGSAGETQQWSPRSGSGSARPRKKQRCDSIASLQLSALHMAALKGMVNEVTRLLEEEKISVNTTVDALGNSALHIAAGGGSSACCSVLLSHGANPNLGNNNGLTPLHLSIRHNQKDCFLMLLSAGADMFFSNVEGITPLHLAAKYGRAELLSILLEKISASGNATTSNGSSSSDPLDSWGQTPLHYACLQKELGTVQLLLSAGSKMLKDHIGMTPLLSAASVGATACIQALLNSGASMADKNRTGKTALHLAVQKGFRETLAVLLAASDAHVNTRDKTGVSPLLEARGAGFPECEALLLEYGGIDYMLDTEDLKCPVCHDVLFHSITLACGHVFCRSCLQAARKLNDSCPVCREAVRLVEGYAPNSRLDSLVRQIFPDLSAQRDSESKTNSMETMIRNMEVFGRALGKDIVLDRNHTCILSIDNEFPMHLTFLPLKDQLFIYAPLAAKFPREDRAALKRVYEMILKESFFGSGFSGGGVGVLIEKELVIFHVELDMLHACDSALNQTSLWFVDTVKRWRKRLAFQFSAPCVVDDATRTSHVPNLSDPSDLSLLSTRKFTGTIKAGAEVAQQNILKCQGEITSGFANMSIQVFNTQMRMPQLSVKMIAPNGEEQTVMLKVFYDAESDHLNVFSPILDFIPSEIDLLPLYEHLLQNSAFGFKTLRGGFGFAVDEDGILKLMTYGRVALRVKDLEQTTTGNNNSFLPMTEQDTDYAQHQRHQQEESTEPFQEDSLKEFVPVFVEQVYRSRAFVTASLEDAKTTLQ